MQIGIDGNVNRRAAYRVRRRPSARL